MGNKTKKEKFRKLSVAAFITGLLPIVSYGLYFLVEIIGGNPYLSWVIFLSPVAAIVCGSIDLINIKAGVFSKKGKEMDIAGIALGVISFLGFIVWGLLVTILS